MPRPYTYGPADVYGITCLFFHFVYNSDAKYNQGAKLIPHKCPYDCFDRVTFFLFESKRLFQVQAVHKRVAQLEAQINVLFSCLKEFLKVSRSSFLVDTNL